MDSFVGVRLQKLFSNVYLHRYNIIERYIQSTICRCIVL